MKARETHLLAALFTVWCFLAGGAVASGMVTVWGQALGRFFIAPVASELLSGCIRFGPGMAFMAIALISVLTFSAQYPCLHSHAPPLRLSAAVCIGCLVPRGQRSLADRR